jgi:hypothetical protein
MVGTGYKLLLPNINIIGSSPAGSSEKEADGDQTRERPQSNCNSKVQTLLQCVQ